MSIVTFSIDLAKNLYAQHGGKAAGKVERRRPAVCRDKLEALVASIGTGPNFRTAGSGGLAGSGAGAVEQRRQATAGSHHRGQRPVSAHLADSGRAFGIVR